MSRTRSPGSDGAARSHNVDNAGTTGGSVEEDRENSPPLDMAGANSATLLYTTEIVKAMFGGSCYYKRASGRLYTATNSLCFYSNLFGSETRLIFRLGEVAEVTKSKSSGVSIKTKDGTEHTFKSFQERDVVFHTILRLHSKESPSPRPESPSASGFGTGNSLTTPDSVTLMSDSDIPSRNPLERRFISFSSFSESPSSIGSSLKAKHFSRRNRKKRRVRSKSVDSCSTRVITETTESISDSSEEEILEEAEVPIIDLGKAWVAKKSAPDKNLKETALKEVHLSCDLETFYENFLADDAPHCLGLFQQKSLGDFDLETSDWEQSDDGAEKRTIKFHHPLKHKLGPSSAAMEKHQVCHRFGEHGVCVESRTYGKGFPAADCFHVEDLWLVEPCATGGVTITVRFQVKYEKSTMFKKMIDANTRNEFMAMYQKYTKMAASALGDETAAEGVCFDADAAAAELEVKSPQPDSFWLFCGTIAFILVIVVILCYHIILLRGRVSCLEGELQDMKGILAQLQKTQLVEGA